MAPPTAAELRSLDLGAWRTWSQILDKTSVGDRLMDWRCGHVDEHENIAALFAPFDIVFDRRQRGQFRIVAENNIRAALLRPGFEIVGEARIVSLGGVCFLNWLLARGFGWLWCVGWSLIIAGSVGLWSRSS
jgi:hypothetical protein